MILDKSDEWAMAEERYSTMGYNKMDFSLYDIFETIEWYIQSDYFFKRKA